MTALALTITNAGRAAIVNAQNTGAGPVALTQIALGSATYGEHEAQTALVAEIKRIATFGADVVADNIIHVTITDHSDDTYTLGEVGIYTDTGVLFGVYSQPAPILEKGEQQIVLLSVDIALTSVPPGSVTIGDTDFMLPPATTERPGIIEIATDAEVDAGADTTRAVTPAGVKRRIDTRAPTSRVLTAGNGLTGGGNLTTDRTITLGTPSTLSGSSPNAVSGESHTHAISLSVVDIAGAAAAARVLTAGNGLTGGGNLTADRTITLGTPSTLSGSSPNAVSGESHTHAISGATETLKGVMEIATVGEALTGADNTRAITPYTLGVVSAALFPVGAIYITAGNLNPGTFIGGTWVQIANGRTLMGVGTLGSDTYAAGATGGAARVTLSSNEMPAHNHAGATGTESATHTHSGATSSAGAHHHSVDIPLNSGAAAPSLESGGPGVTSFPTSTAGDHAHNFTTAGQSVTHTHSIASAGGGGAHENRPPYLAVYFWQRTA